MKISFSTVWADGDTDRIYEILPYIDALEIGSRGNHCFFSDLEKLVQKENIPVTSIHAVANPGKTMSDAYYTPGFASLNEKIRKPEVEKICSTAEWAQKLGSRTLIIHIGRVDDDDLREAYLAYKRNVIEKNDSENEALYHEILTKRRRLSSIHLEAVISGINELCRRYPDINFHIETRLHYYEIPLPDELEIIFRRLPYQNLGYWHDIGHTYVLDALGWVPLGIWQNLFHEKCGGVHVHDVDRSLIDHYPPGNGILDMHRILEKFNNDALFTLEINARNKTEAVIRGIQWLRKNSTRWVYSKSG